MKRVIVSSDSKSRPNSRITASLLGKRVRGTNSRGEAVGPAGVVIDEDVSAKDRYGNYPITIQYDDGRLRESRSFWVRFAEDDGKSTKKEVCNEAHIEKLISIIFNVLDTLDSRYKSSFDLDIESFNMSRAKGYSSYVQDVSFDIVGDSPKGDVCETIHIEYFGNVEKFKSGLYNIIKNRLDKHFFHNADQYTEVPGDPYDRITSANYGGAYDIDPEMWFTKEDIVDFGEHVCDELNEIFDDTYDISNLYMDDPKTIELTVMQRSDEAEFDCTIRVDMRKIRVPRDLITKYGKDAVAALNKEIRSYRSTYGGDTITSVTVVDESKLESEIWAAIIKKMQEPKFGFPEDEIREYSVVEVDSTPQHTRVEVRVEVGYDGMMELAQVLNPIVQKYNKDAYFDMVTSGIMEAYIHNPSAVTSAWNDYPEPPLDPPDPIEPDREDEFEDSVWFSFEDVKIIVDQYGDYEYEDDTYAWAAPHNDPNNDWVCSEHSSIILDDPVSVVEHIDELIATRMPSKPGRYAISGTADLVYKVSGIEVYYVPGTAWSDDRYGSEGPEEEVYTDNAEAEYLSDNSSVKDFKVKPI